MTNPTPRAGFSADTRSPYGRRMRRACASVTAVALGLAACTTNQPIIDRGYPGFDEMAYQHDLAECQGYADQVNVGQEAMGTGLLTAATGAALGAIAGAFGGGAGRGAALGASLGGVTGGVGGGVNAYDRRGAVLRQCLANRGYAVLD